MLNQEEIQEFKKIYEQHFNVEISDEEAKEIANNFVDLLVEVYK